LAAAVSLLVAGGAFFAIGLTAASAAHGEEAAAPIEEIVVTGSRIQRANVTATSPVAQMDAQDLQFTGITRVEDVLILHAREVSDKGSPVRWLVGAATTPSRSLRPRAVPFLIQMAVLHPW
jgi:hypothetical protein